MTHYIYYWSYGRSNTLGRGFERIGEKKKNPSLLVLQGCYVRWKTTRLSVVGSLQFNCKCKFHSRTSREHSDSVASRLGSRHLTVAVCLLIWWSKIQLHSVFQSVARAMCRRWIQRSFCTLARLVFSFPLYFPLEGPPVPPFGDEELGRRCAAIRTDSCYSDRFYDD